MIAARFAGGNLFFGFFVVGDYWVGIFGALGAARSTRIFFEGIFGWGILFLWGGGVCFGLKVLEKNKK